LLEEVGSTETSINYERRNGVGAMVYGVSLEARVIPIEQLTIQLGATLQQSLYDEAEWGWTEDSEAVLRRKTGREMFRTPDSYGYLTLGYEPIEGLDLSVSGTYTGKMWVQHCAGYIEHDEEVRTPAFFDVNCKVAYNFKLSKSSELQIHAGVKNVANSFQRDFDKGADRDGGYFYGPSLPRSYFFGLKFSIF
jgi:outer membrane receptor for ferrienterochelin and colicins